MYSDYSLITYLHIFVNERAELSSISLECPTVTLSILNNFEIHNKLDSETHLILYEPNANCDWLFPFLDPNWLINCSQTSS